ncbi:unnamed protein product, partial [Prorocentrum cordatum]
EPEALLAWANGARLNVWTRQAAAAPCGELLTQGGPRTKWEQRSDSSQDTYGPRQVTDIFSQLDADGDGALTWPTPP